MTNIENIGNIYKNFVPLPMTVTGEQYGGGYSRSSFLRKGVEIS
jgi:hypothetical protein